MLSPSLPLGSISGLWGNQLLYCATTYPYPALYWWYFENQSGIQTGTPAYQRLMLPIIFGHEKVDAKVIDAIWSVLDFVYMAQYPLLSDLNLSKMKDLLSSFNRSKEVFISNGSQELCHFHIPKSKLHALQHFIHDVHSGGTPENCSTKTPESLHIQMCKDPYEASNCHNYDKQILSYLNIQDHLSMHSAYEDYRERKRIEVSKPFFVHCNVTKLMAIENEHSHVENVTGPVRTEHLHTCNGGSIGGLPLTIKITQDQHHCACPIEQVIQLHDIPDLISSICRMQDLNGYDGSTMGCQWEYTIEQLPAEYQFLDVWDHFQLATPACNKFKEEEFLTISCKPRCSSKHVLFTPILVEMNPAMEGIHSKCNQFYSIQSFYHF